MVRWLIKELDNIFYGHCMIVLELLCNLVLEDKLKLNQVMVSGIGDNERGIITTEHDKLR